MIWSRVYIFEESPKSIQDVVGDVYCPGENSLNREKCESHGGYVTTPRSIFGCGKCGAWLFVQKVPLFLCYKNRQNTFFSLRKKMNFLPDKQLFIKVPSRNNSPPTTVTRTKKMLKRVQIWNKRIHFLLADDLNSIFIFQIFLFTFNQKSTAQISSYSRKLTEKYDLLSLQRRNLVDSRFWSQLCYYCSKLSRPKYNNHLTRKSLAAWQLLFSQRQEFLDNHLPRVPITPNQQGTFEMREEKLYSVGAQDLDTSSFQMTDLEDIEFKWENSQLDSVFRPGIDTPFSPTTFHDLSMEGSVENPTVLDEEEDKENAPPPAPSTPVSVRYKEPPRLQRSRAFLSNNRKCTRLCL